MTFSDWLGHIDFAFRSPPPRIPPERLGDKVKFMIVRRNFRAGSMKSRKGLMIVLYKFNLYRVEIKEINCFCLSLCPRRLQERSQNCVVKLWEGQRVIDERILFWAFFGGNSRWPKKATKRDSTEPMHQRIINETVAVHIFLKVSNGFNLAIFFSVISSRIGQSFFTSRDVKRKTRMRQEISFTLWN